MRKRRTVAVVAAGLTAVPIVAPALVEDASAQGPALDPTEAAIVNEVNGVRAQNGIGPVQASAPLAKAASKQSGRCLRRGVLSHAGLGSRVRRYTSAKTVGETLAWVTGGGAAKVVQLWMQSPPHRAQLLSAKYRRIGVGERTGRLNGRRGMMVTANFATG